MVKINSLLIAVLFLATAVQGQKTYMLLDRKAHQRVTVTDSVTKKHLNDGYFPVYSTEYDSLIVLIDNFRNLREDGLKRRFFNSEDFKTGHLSVKIESIRRTYGDGYDISLTSLGPFGESVLKISDARESLGQNEHNIHMLLSYLKSRKKEIDKGQYIVEAN